MVEPAQRAFTPAEARAVVAWSYEPPFDLYELSGGEAVALLTALGPSNPRTSGSR